MIDGIAKRMIEPAMARAARQLSALGITADQVTIVGFALALGAAALIATGNLVIGLVVIIASRICDGLDGAVAREAGASDFGGYLDIVLDFAFYGLIPFAFALFDPVNNAVPAGFLLLAFYVNGASFLAFAAVAEKRGLTTDARGPKSFYFASALAEAGETLAVFMLACLVPAWFPLLAYGFGAICILTASLRIVTARSLFRR